MSAAALTPSRLRAANVYVDTKFDAARKDVRTYYKPLTRVTRPKNGRGVYGHMLDLPQMRRKGQGYQFAKPSAREYVLNSTRWGIGLEMLVDDVLDDNLMVYDDKIDLMGRRSEQHPDIEIWNLVKNGTLTELDGRDITCIDGKAFFADDHPYNPYKSSVGTFDNNLALALNADNFATAYATMQSYKDAEGVNLNLTPTHLIVPPALRVTAKQIVEAMTVANGADNVQRGDVEVISVNYLAGDDTTWYLASAEGETGRPILHQVNEDPRLLAKTEEIRDDKVFYEDLLVWLLKGRGEFGWGLPQRMIRSKP